MITDQTPPTTTTELSVTDKFIQDGLSRFQITEESLIELRDRHAHLLTKEIKDKKDLVAVQSARKEYKAKRVEIEKSGKSIRELSNAFSKAIIQREKSFVDIISSSEEALETKEDAWIDLQERIRLEEEAQEKLRIQNMIDKLAAVESAVDYSTLLSMSDSDFETYLTEVTGQYQLILAKREEERLAEIVRQEELAATRKTEEERLEKQRIEQEAQQKKFEEEQAKFREEQERVRKFNEDVANKLKEAEKKLEDEKRAIQEAKDAEIAEKKRLDDMETAKREAAEKAIRDAEDKRKREEEERVAREKKQKEEEEALYIGLDDKQRFAFHAMRLDIEFKRNPVSNRMKSEKAKKISGEVDRLLWQAWELCEANASKVQTGVPMESDTTGD